MTLGRRIRIIQCGSAPRRQNGASAPQSGAGECADRSDDSDDYSMASLPPDVSAMATITELDNEFGVRRRDASRRCS
jgi:hypothetical protein